jgi:hypothetical protein
MHEDPAAPPPLPSRAASRDDLFARFETLGIPHRTVEHPAFFTVEEGRAFKAEMPGGHSKNLFLKDKKGVLSLAVANWSGSAKRSVRKAGSPSANRNL